MHNVLRVVQTLYSTQNSGILFPTWRLAAKRYTLLETVDDGTMALSRLLRLTKIISNDLEELILRLLLQAHDLILLISAEHDLALVAGMIKYASSAYFDIKLLGVQFSLLKYTQQTCMHQWCDWMQIRRSDNIRGWPYRGVPDDASYYWTRIRLLASMSCAVETVPEKWSSPIIDVVWKIEARKLLENSTVSQAVESFREVNR